METNMPFETQIPCEFIDILAFLVIGASFVAQYEGFNPAVERVRLSDLLTAYYPGGTIEDEEKIIARSQSILNTLFPSQKNSKKAD